MKKKMTKNQQKTMYALIKGELDAKESSLRRRGDFLGAYDVLLKKQMILYRIIGNSKENGGL